MHEGAAKRSKRREHAYSGRALLHSLSTLSPPASGIPHARPAPLRLDTVQPPVERMYSYADPGLLDQSLLPLLLLVFGDRQT